MSLFTEHVVEQLLTWRSAGTASALVTLINVEGSSPRVVGSQMAVTHSGEAIGYISSGCAEAAIIAEAQDAIAAGEPRVVRYGRGSKYLDIELPCGSGIDVHFDPAVTTDTLRAVARAQLARQSTALRLDRSGAKPSALAAPGDETSATHFCRTYAPRLRLVVAGRGVNVDYVAQFAAALEWEVQVATPDEALVARMERSGTHCRHLNAPEDFDAEVLDARSALVLLFHDHEWEPAILRAAAHRTPFYIGALGSRRTHGQRRDLLAALGCAPGFIDTIKGPVGIDINARSPSEIAVSIVADLIAAQPR